MTVPETPLQRIERQWKWPRRGIALVAVGIMLHAIGDYARGTPDTYHDEKSRTLLIAFVLLLQTIADEFSDPRVRRGITLVVTALLAVLFYLTLR